MFREGIIVTTQNKRTTIYLDADLHRALRLKSATLSRSVTELINDAVRESLAKDAEDLAAFEDRVKEPLISYDEMVKRLKKDGKI
jgi:Ribbon-helix-helix protein, copG family